MKILIIGGAGFLGSNLVRACLNDPGAKGTVRVHAQVDVNPVEPPGPLSAIETRNLVANVTQFKQGVGWHSVIDLKPILPVPLNSSAPAWPKKRRGVHD